MTIDEARRHLDTWSTTHGSGITTDEQHEQAKKIAIDTMRKYQMMQAEYETRLKADLVAMLTEIQLEIEEKEQYYQDKFLESKNAVHDAAMGGRMFGCGDCKEIIQQKIDSMGEINHEH